MLLRCTVSGLMTLLRPELLQGHAVALAGPVSEGIAAGLEALGARVEILVEPDQADEDHVGRWARERLPLRAVVFDARRRFGAGGPDALIGTMHQAWLAVREVAVGALIEAPEPGNVVLIAPAPDAGPHALAAAAALENLARTLSVEWARYAVTTVMVAPAAGAVEGQLAELRGVPVLGGWKVRERLPLAGGAAAIPGTSGTWQPNLRRSGSGDQVGDSAQGTTTASSYGLLRAATYSAASLVETFSSTCVSRGGT